MELFAFDRDLPCPACGIRIEIGVVCREPHRDLVSSGEARPSAVHLHVACPGCGWSAYMRTASADAGPSEDDETTRRTGRGPAAEPGAG